MTTHLMKLSVLGIWDDDSVCFEKKLDDDISNVSSEPVMFPQVKST
jgi:hypothetical protein